MRKALLLLLAATAPAQAMSPVLIHMPRYGTWGVNYRDMDRTVKPGDDFYRFAEGTWLRDHPIPADKTGAGYNYELPDETEVQVRAIVEEAANHPEDAMARQIGDFYAAWMDEAGLEVRGPAQLQPYLAKIAAVRDRHQLVQLMADPGFASPINIGPTVDEKDPTR
jgi:predicted metalloendopeptidase